MVVAGEWLYRGAEIHRCSHGASYPYHYHQPPPLYRGYSSASTTFSRTPTKPVLHRDGTSLLRIVVSSSLSLSLPLHLPLTARGEEPRCVLLPFLRPSLFLPSPLLPPGRRATLARLPSRLFRPVFTLSRREHRSLVSVPSRWPQCFPLPRDGLAGCTVHRYSYGTLFAFLPFFSFSFRPLAMPFPRNEKETRFRYRIVSSSPPFLSLIWRIFYGSLLSSVKNSRFWSNIRFPINL